MALLSQKQKKIFSPQEQGLNCYLCPHDPLKDWEWDAKPCDMERMKG